MMSATNAAGTPRRSGRKPAQDSNFTDRLSAVSACVLTVDSPATTRRPRCVAPARCSRVVRFKRDTNAADVTIVTIERPSGVADGVGASPPFVIPPNRRRARLILLGLIALFVGFVIAALVESSTGFRVYMVIGAAILLPLLVGGRRLWNPTAILTITPDGIEHCRLGLIRWAEIDYVATYQPPRGGPMLGVWARDPGALQAREASRWRRWMMAGTARTSAPTLGMSQMLIAPPLTVDALKDAIRARAGNRIQIL